MQFSLKNILIILGVLLLMFGAFKLSTYLNDKKVEKLQTEINRQKIKNDKLIKVRDGFYKKLVADTLTKNELKRKIDSLELEVKDPKIVEVIKFLPREVSKPTDNITIKDSTVKVTDYYPQKENYFIKYESKINTNTGLGTSDWSFGEQEIRLGIGQKEDGTFEVTTKVPDYFNITSVDVETLPMQPQEKDNFGWILGGGYGRDFGNNTHYINVRAGLRFKKTYLTIDGGSNNTINTTLSFEF